MGHSRENYIGLKLPDQAEEASRSKANPTGAECVDCHPWRQTDGVRLSAGVDQSKVDIRTSPGTGLAPAKPLHLLSSAAAQMRDEQENSDTICKSAFRQDK